MKRGTVENTFPDVLPLEKGISILMFTNNHGIPKSNGQILIASFLSLATEFGILSEFLTGKGSM